MDREPLEDERVEQAPAALALIATGVMTRTREQARHEVQQREASLRAGATAARRKPGTEPPLRADKMDTMDPETAFAMSPRFATDAAIRELQQRPAVAFVVQNAAKQDDLSAPSNTAPQAPASRDVVAAPSREKRQTWFSPVHVPLAHRKLVESPRVFNGIAPSKPSAGRATGESPNQNSATSSSRGRVPRVAVLQSASNRGGGDDTFKRRRTVDRHFLDLLRARNQELYDKLVARFRSTNRIEEARRDSNLTHPGKKPSDDDAVTGVTSVEDAVLFFLHEKHAHDVLYFKRRTEARASDHTRAVSDVPVSMSFSASARIDDTARYMPYDLERIAVPPEHGTSDFFIMSSTALVHHSSSSANEVVGEAIPIAQWVMESKMFSLLLAGIPLFQKFLLRKVFVWWASEARKLIFVDLKKRIARTLPLARRSFVRPLLTSFETLHRVQQVQALTLPVKHLAAVQLAAVHEHHRAKLSEAETKLIDAKEELLQLMDTMVHDIQLCTTPSTQLDELYSTEVSEIHTVNPKWKSAPIKALRRHRESVTSQIETAKMDLSLLAKYVRLMEYMFTESVYLMLLGSIRHLTVELRREDNSGAMSASVAIVGDDLVLSPSALETKNVLLEGIARLIRLAGNFHFTKNAIAWSTNRGSGSLTLVSSAFSSDAIASQFDLQEVLRRDNEFRVVSARLIEEVSSCFDEAAHQMKAFESLKPIYAAVQSVSRAETQQNLQLSRTNVPAESTIEIQSVVGISGGELARYLRTLSHRLSVLDRSQHACQKIQSSWKVGFLEIQCRRSVTEILELITLEREMLHKHVLELATKGTNDCLTTIQKASLVYEDRPQLIEYFCEQLKQVKIIKDREKQLHQDIRNVDEIVRALKRYAPDLMSDGAVQYSVLHAIYTRYGVLSQSHDKFVSKMLPNITQQVSNALQRYTIRCQRLLRVYEENVDIATEEELERNIGTFQDIHREIRSIEDATRLYHDYQKMVGMKVMEITMLGEAREYWDEVQDVVTFTIQWKAATRLMESGIFSEQPWRLHLDKVNVFLSRIETIQENRTRSFAVKLLDRLRAAISDYQRRLELVIEMAQPYVRPHHWQQIMALLDIVNYVSASGVVLSDGSTLTLGFLQSRSLWKFEGHIRDITVKARNDSVTESKMEDMKRRLYAAILPIVKIGDVYELEAAGATRLLTQFENDLVTVQTLSQLTSSAQLSTSLAQWADEIGNYQDILESWVAVQGDWKRLVLIFGHHDVQQVVVDATYEFQALDRKWRAMMTAAKGSSSLAVCLREVMSRAFLATCAATSEKLWKELGNYLSEKRHYFPRLYFVSDRDLLHIIASSKHPTRLSRLISKCFQEIHSLKISRGDIPRRRREGSRFTQESGLTGMTQDDSASLAQDYLDDDVAVTLFEIVGIVGVSSDEELNIKSLRVSSSPEIWMRDLSNRIQEGIKEAVCFTMDGTLTSLFDGHFADLLKPRIESQSHSIARHTSTILGVSPSSWLASPLHVIILCINVLLTSELTPLVCADRSGAEWNAFWDGYRAKKENLAAFVRQRNITSRERIVGSSIIVLMMNKQSGIEDLYHDQTIQTTSSSFASQHHQDTTAIHYNYANGSSFSWTKIMRFYFEPFDKKCVIHHCVKSHDYGNSFIGDTHVRCLHR